MGIPAGSACFEHTNVEEQAMNRATLKRSLITLGLLAVVGTVGAETCNNDKTAERIEANGNSSQTQQQELGPIAGTETAPGYGTWNPWAEMHQMQHRIDSLFEDSWQRMRSEFGAAEPFAPLPSKAEVTLQEEKGNYVVTTALPGIEDGDVNVSLNGRLLRISAQHRGQQKETADNGQVVRQERYASSVQRAFTLPGPVDVSGMHTKLDDGVLTVTIPKANS
jgi:HSP20 family protein